MGKPHKWADVIKEWADGAQVEFRNSYEGEKAWRHVSFSHCWREETEYRIKPEPVYPVTRMSDKEIEDAIQTVTEYQYVSTKVATTIANAAIRRAIQDGDVILPNKD